MIVSSRMLATSHRTLELRPGQRGFSLVELIVAVGVTSIVLLVLGLLSLNGLQSFLVMGASTALDDKSRLAADQISRELRQATKVVRYQVEADRRTLELTNSVQGFSVEYIWSADTRTLTCEITGQPPATLLQDCDVWETRFFQNIPQAAVTQPYLPATNLVGELAPERARIVMLSWKCSRPILGSKVKTGSTQMLQVALRNTAQP